MRNRCSFILGLAAYLALIIMPVYAHDSGPDRPTYLSFQYYTSGPLYNRLKDAFYDEWQYGPNRLPGSPIYGVHEIDLNGDNIPEMIIRFPDFYTHCNEIGCHNAVIAVTEKEIKKLAFFKYAEVNIATTKTNNVIDLIIYDDPLNDYSGTIYKWDSEKQVYIKN